MQPGVGFAMIGIASGQTLRVNVVNMGTSASTSTSSCNVIIRFLDPQGAVLKEAAVNVVANKAASFDLNYSQTGTQGTAGTRSQLRAVVLFGYSGGAQPGPDTRDQYDCNIVPSLEIYDNSSGRTSLIVTDFKPLPVPDPRSVAKGPSPEFRPAQYD
jgi:hypothetical protein